MGSLFSYVHDSTFTPPKPNYALLESLGVYKIDGVSLIRIKPLVRKNGTKVIVFSHGNGCDIAIMYSYLVKLSNHYGVDVVCYDYPGYGLSNGYPTELSCNRALDVVIKSLICYDIILMGHSLGTAVSVSYCYNFDFNPKLLILISPFKSIVSTVVDSKLVETSCQISNASTFRTLDYIRFIKCNIKIYHGDSDNMFSEEHAISLYNQVQNRCCLQILQNIGHCDILDRIVCRNLLVFNPANRGIDYVNENTMVE